MIRKIYLVIALTAFIGAINTYAQQAFVIRGNLLPSTKGLVMLAYVNRHT